MKACKTMLLLFLSMFAYANAAGIEFNDLLSSYSASDVDTAADLGTNFRCQFNILPTNLEGCVDVIQTTGGEFGDTVTTDWQYFCTRYLHNHNRENPSDMANVVQKIPSAGSTFDCLIKKCDGTNTASYLEGTNANRPTAIVERTDQGHVCGDAGDPLLLFDDIRFDSFNFDTETQLGKDYSCEYHIITKAITGCTTLWQTSGRAYTAVSDWRHVCANDAYQYNLDTENTLKANAFMKFNIGGDSKFDCIVRYCNETVDDYVVASEQDGRRSAIIYSPAAHTCGGTTVAPTAVPTGVPTTGTPSTSPTVSPTHSPIPPTPPTTGMPSTSPTTGTPSVSPTNSPSTSPTISPTNSPSTSPTVSPTNAPTGGPTNAPTDSPTASPTDEITRSFGDVDFDELDYSVDEELFVNETIECSFHIYNGGVDGCTTLWSTSGREYANGTDWKHFCAYNAYHYNAVVESPDPLVNFFEKVNVGPDGRYDCSLRYCDGDDHIVATKDEEDDRRSAFIIEHRHYCNGYTFAPTTSGPTVSPTPVPTHSPTSNFEQCFCKS